MSTAKTAPEPVHLTDLLARTRAACLEAIAAAPLVEAGRRLAAAGFGGAAAIEAARAFWLAGRFPGPVRELIDAGPSTAVVRRVLLEGILTTLDRLPGEPLPSSVKALLCEECAFVAHPGEGLDEWFDPDRYPLRLLTSFVLLYRYPAGQLCFELSGMPRSWFAHMRRRDLPGFLRYFLLEERRFSPYYFVHIGVRRQGLPILLERESNRSYYRMASTIALHPEIRGILACSWLYHRDNHAINPHLRWVTAVMEENGALITKLGPADPEQGFLAGHAKRRELYESGQWKPRDGLVVWPRARVLAWAERHPELADAVS